MATLLNLPSEWSLGLNRKAFMILDTPAHGGRGNETGAFVWRSGIETDTYTTTYNTFPTGQTFKEAKEVIKDQETEGLGQH